MCSRKQSLPKWLLLLGVMAIVLGGTGCERAPREWAWLPADRAGQADPVGRADPADRAGQADPVGRADPADWADATIKTGLLATRAGEVEIRVPSESPAIATGTVDEKGRAVTVSCGTCHATRPANPHARIGTSLLQFHQGLVGPHGNLTCASCHHPDDGYQSLRLADGSKLAHADVMKLCAQCHGPQFRDYQHGAHGGMTGYWDLAKGGRQRNNCIDCHAPHAPAYPVVHPARGPNDRFLKGDHHD